MEKRLQLTKLTGYLKMQILLRFYLDAWYSGWLFRLFLTNTSITVSLGHKL